MPAYPSLHYRKQASTTLISTSTRMGTIMLGTIRNLSLCYIRIFNCRIAHLLCPWQLFQYLRSAAQRASIAANGRAAPHTLPKEKSS